MNLKNRGQMFIPFVFEFERCSPSTSRIHSPRACEDLTRGHHQSAERQKTSQAQTHSGLVNLDSAVHASLVDLGEVFVVPTHAVGFVLDEASGLGFGGLRLLLDVAWGNGWRRSSS